MNVKGHLEHIDEDIPVRDESLFLDMVYRFAVSAEDVIRSLRLNDYGTKEIDLGELICPDLLQDDNISVESMREVLREYLNNVKLDIEAGINDPNSPMLSDDSIERNTSRCNLDIVRWKDRVYTAEREELDLAVRGLEERINAYALNQSLALLGRIRTERGAVIPEILGLEGLRLNGALKGEIRAFSKQLYKAAGLKYFDDTELLYKLSFNACMKAAGWNELSDEELLEKLEEQKVPVELLKKYTGRDVNVKEKEVKTVTDIAREVGNQAERLSGCVNGESSVDFRGQNVHYIEMPTASYGSALKNLRDACAEDKNSKQPLLDGIPRPLTLKESFIARIMQPELWNVYLDTLLGVAYSSQDKNKFKINQVCRELAGLSEGVDRSYLPIDYNGFNGIELDRRNALYNRLLTREQFLAPHPAWYAALEGDTDLMKAIADHVYTEQRRSALGFVLCDAPQKDQLRHLCVDSIDNNSNADSYYDLVDGCCFLMVTPN